MESPSQKDLDDPLHHGILHLKSTEVTPLQQGKHVTQQLEELIKSRKNVTEIVSAPDNVISFYQEIFPEVATANDLGRSTPEAMGQLENNTVAIEIDEGPTLLPHEEKYDIYIGGPAALCSASIQSKSPEAKNVLYIHDGYRGASNWKGSASYIHMNEAVPIYYTKKKTFVHAFYHSLRRYFLQAQGMDSYIQKYIKSSPHYYRLLIDFPAAMRYPITALKFVLSNQLASIKDIGTLFGIESRFKLPTASYSISKYLIPHALAGYDILKILNPGKDICLKSNDTAKSLMYFEGGHKEADLTYNIMDEIVGTKYFRRRNVSQNEIEEMGFSSDYGGAFVEFFDNGYMLPDADQTLEEMVTENGGQIEEGFHLRKILVKPTDDHQDATATRIVLQNTKTKEFITRNVKSLYLSLGPSMSQLKVLPPSEDRTLMNSLFQSSNLLKTMLPMAGGTCTFLVKVDMSIIPESKLESFRTHLTGVSLHIVRLGEKDVYIDGKHFKYFTMLVAGAASINLDRYISPELILNMFESNAKAFLQLGQEGIEYDILSVRSCARGVTSSNSPQFLAPLQNTVMVYGLGGVGMTTMAANALFMKALLALRTDVAEGKITEKEFFNNLKSSNYESIPHFDHPNPFIRDSRKFVNRDLQRTARMLGFPKRHSQANSMVQPFISQGISNNFLKWIQANIPTAYKITKNLVKK
ncbi:uncharacterized protein [Clytia hemisphaerica]|uniref:Uncharacterized protein n=1 Tax=Clytia hemisphaerica TaxID=252671 RepID=A0A7M5X764_9CNID